MNINNFPQFNIKTDSISGSIYHILDKYIQSYNCFGVVTGTLINGVMAYDTKFNCFVDIDPRAEAYKQHTFEQKYDNLVDEDIDEIYIYMKEWGIKIVKINNEYQSYLFHNQEHNQEHNHQKNEDLSIIH